MRSTNELSSYRYAAVVHVKLTSHPPQQIHDVGLNEWIDFIEGGSDRESLSDLLNSPQVPITLAVSNIPHSKTIFEKHLVDSLKDANTAIGNDNWILRARQAAHISASLSVVNLVDVASQAGYRVETSWSRQSSQRGGLDAIFHRYQPTDGTNRVLFRFPADRKNQPCHSLCSQPLRQQLRIKKQDMLRDMLRVKLPCDMVPQTLTIIDKMPLNENGKVDRRALAENIQSQTQSRGPGRQPTSEAERQMQKIWADILLVEPDTIGPDDSFFHLGGNSMAAMKVVSKARKSGFVLSVGDIFHHPELHSLIRQESQAYRNVPFVWDVEVSRSVVWSLVGWTTFWECKYEYYLSTWYHNTQSSSHPQSTRQCTTPE